MPESDLNETQPNASQHETRPQRAVKPSKSGFPAWLVVLVILVLIVIGVLSGYAGGMSQRYAAENTVVTGQLQQQFDLGQQALTAGQYELAKQYFDFVVQHNPDYPGIQAAYAKLLVAMNVTSTPLFTPTSLYTATPDSRGADQIFSHIQDLLKASQWDDALTNLDQLRQQYPTYQTAQVDGMYYIALRQRGMSKIVNTDCKNINLEGGIYDLTLAERFVGVGHLDANADAYRTWARLYILGASFWSQDWVQAQNYFAQVMGALPNLSDSSCTTATERWRQATINYAEELMNKGDFCGASKQFDAAFAVGNPNNGNYYPTATEVVNVCNGDSGAPATATP